jgi:hypothetical protein
LEALCESFGIKHKPTSVKNPTANAILVWVHHVITLMLCTAELNMANIVEFINIHVFLTDMMWATCSTYHTLLKACPGTAIFGWNMLFNIPYWADWSKIGEHRKHQTDHNMDCENCSPP